jgi:RNA polymerase sigma factor (sigma-70 family)
MTTAFSNSSQVDDATLISASRSGNRDAFGQIVRRYQGMIAGLIYASVGDVHRSEDLAQETFISAWKSLSGLREPAKLPAWLCQIARHRILDHVRSATRQKSNFADFQKHQQPIAATSADAPIISAEENELLWRTLSQMPQPYRETLVLYYRQGHSTTDVAAAMETTEAAVRQRLSRGREMLRENLAQLLEKNLSRTAPGEAFTAAVVAALPAIVPATIKAGALGGVMKGSAAVGGAGVLTYLSLVLAPIMGLTGGIVGAWTSLRDAKTKRQKKFLISFMVRGALIIVAGTALLFRIQSLAQYFKLSGKEYIVMFTAVFAAYWSIMIVFMSRGTRSYKTIRAEEGFESLPPPLRAIAPKFLLLGIIGITAGSLSWMIGMAGEARDNRSVAILVTTMVLMIVCAYWRLLGRDAVERQKFALLYAAGLGAIYFVMLNWRMHLWIAVQEHVPIAQVRQRIPYWTINLLLIVIWTAIMASMTATMRRRPIRRD